MLNFKEIKDVVENHLAKMMDKYERLYVVDVDKDEMWNTYLDAIPPQHNLIYKTRREYDCSCCRHFIKSIGNVVGLEDGNIETIWDTTSDNEAWNSVLKKMSDFIKAHNIEGVYLSKFDTVGTDYNMDMDDEGNPIRWNHFFVKLNSKFVFRER